MSPCSTGVIRKNLQTDIKLPKNTYAQLRKSTSRQLLDSQNNFKRQLCNTVNTISVRKLHVTKYMSDVRTSTVLSEFVSRHTFYRAYRAFHDHLWNSSLVGSSTVYSGTSHRRLVDQKIEAECNPETSVNFHTHRRENLQSYLISRSWFILRVHLV
jgi:hypothetical protein